MTQTITQQFVNKSFYFLLLFTLIFGVLFYDALPIGFTDEICAVLACALYGFHIYNTPDWSVNKFFLTTIGVFLFYLSYSLFIGVTSRSAVITDFIIQIKPYLAFFAIYGIAPKLDKGQKTMIKQLCILFSLYLLGIGLTSIVYFDIIEILIKHPSRLATAASILALLYLYCSDYSKRDKLIFVLLLSAGLLSTRSKFFGFFVICVFVVYYVDNKFRLEFNMKNTLLFLLAFTLLLYVAQDKIYLYFVQGGFGDGKGEEDLYARMALYYFSLYVFQDYFPLGSGFATYATYASGETYSPIYEKYGMAGMHGLTEAKPEFIADTYYPALAQFGVVGAFLFFAFWIFLTKRSMSYFIQTNHTKNFTISMLIIAFFLIECTSDATITHNRGLFMMMLLGLVFSEIKFKKGVCLR